MNKDIKQLFDLSDLSNNQTKENTPKQNPEIIITKLANVIRIVGIALASIVAIVGILSPLFTYGSVGFLLVGILVSPIIFVSALCCWSALMIIVNISQNIKDIKEHLLQSQTQANSIDNIDTK